MKIIYIGTIYPHPGGSAISGSQIIQELASRGNEVFAIAPISEMDFPNRHQFDGLLKNVSVIRYTVPYYNTSTHDTHSQSYVDSEFEKIQQLYEEIVSYFLPDIVFLGRETFAPLMARLVKHNSKFVLRVAGATTLGISNQSFSAEIIENYLHYYKLADLLVCPATHIVKFLERSGISKVVHIRNGVNVDRFNLGEGPIELRNDLDIQRESKVVSHISGLESIKRPMDFMEAAKEVHQRVAGIIFLVVGDGPGLKSMKEYANAHDLEDVFRFVGWIDYENVNQYFNISDVVVMPCEADTQPRVYLESMAAGKYLIASEIKASLEVIVDEVTGFLYPKGNVAELAQRIVEVLVNSHKYLPIGGNARKYVLDNHSWPCVIDRYEEEFSELIKGK